MITGTHKVKYDGVEAWTLYGNKHFNTIKKAGVPKRYFQV
jgi:hypothetical protein